MLQLSYVLFYQEIKPSKILWKLLLKPTKILFASMKYFIILNNIHPGDTINYQIKFFYYIINRWKGHMK